MPVFRYSQVDHKLSTRIHRSTGEKSNKPAPERGFGEREFSTFDFSSVDNVDNVDKKERQRLHNR